MTTTTWGPYGQGLELRTHSLDRSGRRVDIDSGVDIIDVGAVFYVYIVYAVISSGIVFVYSVYIVQLHDTPYTRYKVYYV